MAQTAMDPARRFAIVDTMHRLKWGRAGLAVGLTLVIGACASRVGQTAVAPPSTGRADAAVAGALVIEQFLQAANTRDLATMSRLFGTKQGPIIELYGSQQVDRRMRALAALLRHEDYAIRGASTVSGRTDGARQMIVRMRVHGRETDVPYTLVWSDGGSWLIEQIDLERVTGR